nr:NAD(P)/FAD-dependent oxidoreductase [uncultured Sphingosinicella sp.]
MYDAIVVGGSFAGLSAAMQLVRARRRVLMIDAGRPRNRFSHASHGFLGLDGTSPAAIRELGLRQLGAYPTFELRGGTAEAARRGEDGFAVAVSGGEEVRARRLVLATGVEDRLPDVPGLEERWGKSVLHCPYCHGYEVRDRPLGVLATGPMAAHQAALIPDWGPTTLFLNGRFEPDADQLASLTARGVTIERAPVVAALGAAPGLTGLRLADGREVPVEGLFVAPSVRMASQLPHQIGCAFEEGPLGPYLRVDERQQTSVQGVYAAGDAARPMHNATFASADGVMAGVGAHQSLLH